MKPDTSKVTRLNVPKDWDKEMAGLLGSVQITTPDVIPPGWKTRRQWQDKLGMACSAIKTKFAMLKAAGKIECKNFRVKTSDKIQSLPHYRVK